MKKEVLTFPLSKNEKYIAMLAPSFVVDFSYPQIISQLKELGFDEVVELTFGAKMINGDYHKTLKKSRKLIIASVCPGIVETIKARFPKYKKNLINIDSPMIAMGKICRNNYPNHKLVFFSPCNFKKIEASKSKFVDYVMDYRQLKKLLNKFDKKNGRELKFDKFYNDYTKIYPLAGGLSKTAKLRNILKPEEVEVVDGIGKVMRFLKNPNKKVKFLDATFCEGGCIGGDCINSKLPIFLKRKKVLDYMKIARKEAIPENRIGLVKRAEGISFKSL